MKISARDLAILLNGKVDGEPEQEVTKLSKIEEADQNCLSFIANPKYAAFAETTKASILIVSNNFSKTVKTNSTLIRVDDPYIGFTAALEYFSKSEKRKVGIETPSFIGEKSVYGDSFYLGAFSYLGENVKIGNGVQIFPNSFIGDNVEIGDDTVVNAGVKIYQHCILGKNCILHSGVVIGSDGFGFAPQQNGEYKKIVQLGNVVLEDDIEIGANTVIDRATIGSTVIRSGVKLDNLVQIAHNVELGENTVIASQAGISGSTKLGKNCMVGGQAGFVGHLKIADEVKVNAQSGVSKSIDEKGKAITGSPASAFRDHYKNQAYIKKIPELIQRLEKLEKQIQEP